MNQGNAVFESNIPNFPAPRRGKVRDVYDLGDTMLLVATDRISAFDSVFPTPIPDKGKILTAMSLFWLDLLADVVPNHLITSCLDNLDLPEDQRKLLDGRALVVKKAKIIPFECIVRGYIIGTGWQEYKNSGTVGGIPMPAGLPLAGKLPQPLFTPSTKAEKGHDINVPFEHMVKALGLDLAEQVRQAALALYDRAQAHALDKDIIIADTKFEFGLAQDGQLLLIDEVLTPDSSRFWPANEWTPGKKPPSYDKQYLRDWLEKELCWNKEPPAPTLPDRVVKATRAKYLEAYERLTGKPRNA